MRRIPIRWRLTGLVMLVSAVVVTATATIGLDRAEDALIRERLTDQEETVRDWLSYPIDEFFAESTDLELHATFTRLVERDADSAAAAVAELAGWTTDGPQAFLGDIDQAIVVSDGVSELVAIDDLEVTPVDLTTLYDVAYPLIEGRSTPSADDMAFTTIDVGGTPLVIAARVDDVRGSLASTRDSAIVWGPALVLVAGLVAWLLTRGALRPVAAMTDRVGRISPEETHRGVRVEVPPTRDELRALGTQLNELLDRISASDAVRRRFTADASHELRSPLAVLRSEAEQALDPGSSLDRFELADTVLAETARMERLVDDLLVLARIDETGPTSRPVTIDLDDVVLAEAARARRLPVGVGGVGAGRVLGDPDQLARVVRHLLDNAARHAVARVEISLGSSGGTVSLLVDDDGPGVDQRDRERIFDRFVRLDHARSRDRGGAGLGLAVVAACVRSAGGHIAVDDSPLGGARFAVTLPAAPDVAAPPAAGPRRDDRPVVESTR